MKKERHHMLFETWINGNRKDVVETILSLPTAEAVLLTSQFVPLLREAEDKRVFRTLVTNRIGKA